MIKSRKVIIENAIKKLFGEQIKLNFSSKKINITHSAKLQKGVINELSENKGKSSDFQKPPTPSKKPQSESYDESTKNLANFFNGEIIDLDE